MKAKFGLIGCGLIGQKRGKHLEKFGDIVFVCDRAKPQWRLLKSRPRRVPGKFHWAVTMLTLYLLLLQPINPNCKASIAQRFPCFH